MIDCPPHDEWFLHLDDDLDPARAAQLASHLEGCASCRALVEGLRETDGRLALAFAALPAPQESVLVRQGALARPRAAARWWAAAAGLLAAVGLGVLIGRWTDARRAPTPAPRVVQPTPAPVSRPDAPSPRLHGPEAPPALPSPGELLATRLVTRSDPGALTQARLVARALARRELVNLTRGTPAEQADARTYFAGPGRHWLLTALHADTPDHERLVRLARKAWAPGLLSPAELIALAEDDRLTALALALGAGPTPETAGRWLARGVADPSLQPLLLPKLRALGPAPLLPWLPVWPAALISEAAGQPAWARAIAQAASEAGPAREPARDWLSRQPLASLAGLLTEPSGRPAVVEALADRGPVALAALVGATGDGPPPPALRRLLASASPVALARVWAGLPESASDRLTGWLRGDDREAALLAALVVQDDAGMAGHRALRRLAEIAPHDAAAGIRRRLAGSDPAALVAGVAALLVAPAGHRPMLREMLDDDDLLRRRLGLVGLALVGRPVDATALAARTRRGESDWNQLVWSAVCRLAPAQAGAVLARGFATRGRPGRSEALGPLVQRRPAEAARWLGMGLADPDPAVRVRALELLPRPLGEGLAKALRGLRRDPHAAVRAAAFSALGRVAPPRALNLVRIGLSDAAAGVRREAARALGQLADRGAIQPLLGALDDPHEDVVVAAADGLMALTAHHLPLPAPLTVRARSDYRSAWRGWLAKNPQSSARGWHSASLRSSDPRAVALAMRAMSRYEDPASRAELVEAWRAADPGRRRRLLAALDMQGPAFELASLGALIDRHRRQRDPRLPSGALLLTRDQLDRDQLTGWSWRRAAGPVPADWGDALTVVARSGPPRTRLAATLAAAGLRPRKALAALVEGMAGPEPELQRMQRRDVLERLVGLRLPEDALWQLWWAGARRWLAEEEGR